MKKSPLLVIILCMAFIACKKETAKCPYTASTAVATQTEIDSIQRYVNLNDPTAIKFSNGVFYKIAASGTGTSPTVCSDVSVKYAGYLFNSSTAFDASTTPVIFPLGKLIVGWQNVLSLIKPGGSITLYIPPSLGYGSQPIPSTGTPVIPANSYLKFTIDLVAVQ